MIRDTAIVDAFLEQHRVAFVGVSRDAADFSRRLFRDWRAKGYELVPVHPAAAEIDGVPAYRRVQDVPGGIDAAFLMTPPAATDQVVQDCAAAGVHTVWMHRGAGQGSVSQSAVDLCRQHGIAVVPGACPYMFLPDANLFHRLHRLILTMFGRKAA